MRTLTSYPALASILTAFILLSFTSLTSAQDIVDDLREYDQFSEFADLLEETGLAEQLTDGDYTVFAPSNEAIQGLPPQITQDERQMSELLLGHFVEGENSSEELAEIGNVQAANGMPLQVQAGQPGELMVGNSMISEPDMELDNGVAHEVSEIIIPQQQQQQPPQDPPQDPPR